MLYSISCTACHNNIFCLYYTGGSAGMDAVSSCVHTKYLTPALVTHQCIWWLTTFPPSLRLSLHFLLPLSPAFPLARYAKLQNWWVMSTWYGLATSVVLTTCHITVHIILTSTVTRVPSIASNRNAKCMYEPDGCVGFPYVNDRFMHTCIWHCTSHKMESPVIKKMLTSASIVTFRLIWPPLFNACLHRPTLCS